MTLGLLEDTVAVGTATFSSSDMLHEHHSQKKMMEIVGTETSERNVVAYYPQHAVDPVQNLPEEVHQLSYEQ